MTGSAAATVRTAAFLPQERRWVSRGAPAAAQDVDALASALRLPEPLCRLLVLRGQATPDAAARFLRPPLDGLLPPANLAGLDAAVDRIMRAVRGGQRILAHGDYDVDGMCAAALYTRVLRRLGADVIPFVPHRMKDGYDLGPAGVRRAVEAGASLILTGDCGTVAHNAVHEAARHGIDVIVTDHHTPGATLPAAAAVVNPNRADCVYGNKGLAGAGVAFKLCEALVEALGGDRDALLWEMDLVALVTIADLAPLRGENRILVHYGLRVLRQTRNVGLRALLRGAGIDADQAINAHQVSHVIAPRLNAVGRMGAASRGVDLLLATDAGEAEALAAAMDEENRTRQAVDRRILDEALQQLEQSYDPARDCALVLSAPDWHAGVIGIVASRVVERVHRPVVLIAEDATTGWGRGSARSIPPFHLYEGIHACADLLERYGGHRQAAGLDIRLDRIAAFREAFNAHARSVLTDSDLVPEVRVDLEVRLDEVGDALHRALRHFGPFGIGNPQPVFVTRGVGVAGRSREAGEGQHIRLVLADGDARLPAIGFRLAERVRDIDWSGTRIDAAFHLTEDRWRGRSQLQARLLDLRPAE